MPQHFGQEDIVDVIERLQRKIERLESSPVRVGRWTIGTNGAGDLVVTDATTNAVTVLATA